MRRAADELDEGLLQRLEGLIVACRMQRDAYDGASASPSVATALGDGSDPAAVIQQMAQARRFWKIVKCAS